LGTTTLGERGQVVIPAEARKTLAVEAGDKFVVFGDKRGNSVTLVKADVISQFANVFLEKSDKFGKIAQSILGQINDTDEDGDGGEGSDEGGNGDEDDKADDAESDFPAGDAAGTGNAGIGTSTDAATNQ
jgi:AbrB family looped-hinge helix DNA binding protein